VREKDLANIVTRPPRPPDWLVPGLLHKGTMVVLAGSPGSGKSVLSLCLAVAKATGFPFLGRDLVKGRVLYFDEENSQPDFEEYLRWIWRGLGRPEPSLLNENIRMERFSLAHAARNFRGQYNYMEQCAKEFQPELTIIDTATPACQIKDENDNAMATEAIQQLRTVQQASEESCMLVLKHAKVDQEHGTHTVRGAKAWVGSTDATIFHMTVPGKERLDGLRDSQLVPEKIRAFGLQATLRIHPTWIGPQDDKGLQLEVGT
jgi:RecA-family ATPase